MVPGPGFRMFSAWFSLADSKAVGCFLLISKANAQSPFDAKVERLAIEVNDGEI